MTQTQIRCFLAAAETLNFSRAAEALMISQPSVSKMIGQMEEELGLPLFERLRQGIRLTPAGQIMQTYFSEMESGYSAALESAARAYHGPSAKIRLGCLEGWDLTYFYYDIRDYFSRNLPNFQLELVGLEFYRVEQALKMSSVDAVITMEDRLMDFPEFQRAQLETCKYYILMSGSYPPVQIHSHMELSDFRDSPFFVIGDSERNGNMSQIILDASLRHGFYPKLVNTSGLVSTLLYIQEGRGVMLADEWLAARASYLYRSVETDIPCSIALGWLDDGNRAKQLFVEELLRFYRRERDPKYAPQNNNPPAPADAHKNAFPASV